MTGMQQLIQRLEEAGGGYGKGPWPKDIERVGKPRKETQAAPRGRGLADSWRLVQGFRVGEDQHEVTTSWKGIPWTEDDQKAFLFNMLTELSMQLRTGRSRLVPQGAGKWVLP